MRAQTGKNGWYFRFHSDIILCKRPNDVTQAVKDENLRIMAVRFHPHAKQRMAERGATNLEVSAAVQDGERFEAKFGRAGFRRNFVFEKQWRGRYYKTKQVEVYAVREDQDWLVISVIVRYF